MSISKLIASLLFIGSLLCLEGFSVPDHFQGTHPPSPPPNHPKVQTVQKAQAVQKQEKTEKVESVKKADSDKETWTSPPTR